jgi:hypothetical protein
MTKPYGWPYAVLRMRPRAKWMAIYDEIFAGLASGEDALARDAASLGLLEAWPAIVEQLRREARNATRLARYAARKREASQ